jgi:hypothetical protein
LLKADPNSRESIQLLSSGPKQRGLAVPHVEPHISLARHLIELVEIQDEQANS